MALYDFSAPFVAARIRDRNGNTFPLWTNVGGSESNQPVVPGAEELRSLAFLQEVQVELGLSHLPQITAQLSPPFHDGLRFLDSELVNAGGDNVIEIQLGYSSGTGGAGAVLSPPFAGTIFAPDVTIDVDIQISLKAQGLGNPSEQDGVAVPAEGETRAEFIERIAEGAGRGLRVNFDEARQDSTVASELDATANGIAQGGQSDWMMLWQMADRTSSWMYMVGDTIYWVPRRRRLTSGEPVRSYRLFEYPGGRLQGASLDSISNQLASSELPILSFSCSTEGAWLRGVHGMRVRDVNEQTREDQQEVVTEDENPTPTGNDQASVGVESNEGLPFNTETGQGLQTMPGSPDNADAVAQVRAEHSRSGNLGLQVEIETLGDPTIQPGDTVRLYGVGRRFEGLYAVFKVVHSIGVGGFSTNLTLNVTVDGGRTPSQGGTPARGGVNTQQPRQEAADEVVAEPLDPFSVEGI